MNAIKALGLIILLVSVLAGCQAEKPSQNELMFGSSVRHAVNGQKLYAGPVDDTPPEGVRGAYVDNVMNSLDETGKDVGKRDSAKFESVIELFKAKK